MPRVHTHYDNLKVARDAPLEVIHAAYKSLAAMYHHRGDPESERIFRIINNSYIALCDPARKRDHDRWIAQQDSVEFVPPASEPLHEEPGAPKSVFLPIVRKPFGRRSLIWSAGVIITIALIGAFISSTTTTANVPATEQPTVGDAPSIIPPIAPAQEPLQLRPRYTRPSLDPNGEPWPTASGYLAGYPLLNTDGQSSLTVDNRKRDSDVLVNPRPPAVRVLFIRAQDWIKMEAIAPGPYDLRYQDLDSGEISRSDSFDLKENHEDIQKSDGVLHKTRSTDMTLTLYTVIDGNTRFETIGPEDFR